MVMFAVVITTVQPLKVLTQGSWPEQSGAQAWSE